MTSVQVELRSTRLCAGLNTASSSSDTPHEESSPTPPADLMATLSGRFAEDRKADKNFMDYNKSKR